MDAMILLIWLSLGLVAVALIGYVWTVREQTFDHSDRLKLSPFDEDDFISSEFLRKERDGNDH